jgi:hypothetical protein
MSLMNSCRVVILTTHEFCANHTQTCLKLFKTRVREYAYVWTSTYIYGWYTQPVYTYKHRTPGSVCFRSYVVQGTGVVVSEYTVLISLADSDQLIARAHDDDAFYLFLQKQKIALKPYTPPGYFPPHEEKRKQTHVMMLSP